MLLRKRRGFIKPAFDSVCSKESLLGAVKAFMRQVLYEELGIIGEADVHAAAKGLVPAVEVIGAKGKTILWNFPLELCHTKSFSLTLHSTSITASKITCGKRLGMYFCFQNHQKVMSAVSYNRSGRTATCRPLKSCFDIEEVNYLASAGSSSNSCLKTVWAGAVAG